MYHKATIFLLLFLAAIIQVSLLPNIFPFGAVPNLVLLIIIILTSKKSFDGIWIWAAVSGLILDVMTFSSFGINAISFLIVSFGISSLSKRFLTSQRSGYFLTLASFAALGIFVDYFLTSFIHTSFYLLNGEMMNFLRAFQLKELALRIVYGFIIFSLIYNPIMKSKIIFQMEENKLALN